MIRYELVLRDILIGAHAAMKEMDVDDLNYKESNSKWSKKEILGHLVDSACINHERFVRAPSQDTLVFLPYDQVEWVKLNRYQQQEFNEVLDTWWVTNRHIANFLEGVSQEVYTKKFATHNFDVICLRPLAKEEFGSLSYLVIDYLIHLEHHLNQIIPDYKKQLPRLQIA